MLIELFTIVVAATSVWVLIDSKSIGVRKGEIKGFLDMGPTGWFFSCLLCWILAFPAYLAQRREYKRRAAMVGQTSSAGAVLARPVMSALETPREEVAQRCPYCAETIQAAAVKCRYCGESLVAGQSIKKSSAIGIAAVVLGIAGAVLPYFAAVFLVPAAFICGLIAYRQGQHGMGWAGVVLGIVGAVGIIYTSQRITKIVRDPFNVSLPQPPFAPPPVVTRAKYERIQEGMNYDQVRAVVGETGEELSRSDLAGYTTVMYAWKNSNGSNMNAMFQNGRLVNKAQFGLK